MQDTRSISAGLQHCGCAGTCCLSCLCSGFIRDSSSPNLCPCWPAIVRCCVLLPDDLQRQLGQHVGEQVVHALLPRPPGHLQCTNRLSQQTRTGAHPGAHVPAAACSGWQALALHRSPFRQPKACGEALRQKALDLHKGVSCVVPTSLYGAKPLGEDRNTVISSLSGIPSSIAFQKPAAWPSPQSLKVRPCSLIDRGVTQLSQSNRSAYGGQAV